MTTSAPILTASAVVSDKQNISIPTDANKDSAAEVVMAATAAADFDENDDGTFTPVVSHHHRRERKITRGKERVTRDGKLIGVAKQRTRQERIDGHRGGAGGYDRRESKRSNDRRATDSKEMKPVAKVAPEAVVTAGLDGAMDGNGTKAISIGGGSSGSAGEESASTGEQDSTKFVEAPLPKVNAWKVSKVFLFAYLYYLYWFVSYVDCLISN